MRRVFRVLAAAAALSSLCCASARADVAYQSSASARSITPKQGGNALVVASRAHGYDLPLALITKGRKLRPGTYVVTLTTLDANGKALASAKVKFWVLR